LKCEFTVKTCFLYVSGVFSHYEIINYKSFHLVMVFVLRKRNTFLYYNVNCQYWNVIPVFLTKQNQPKSQTETKQIYLFTLIFTCVSILWLRVNKFFWVAFQIKNSWIELSLKITSLPGSVICNV